MKKQAGISAETLKKHEIVLNKIQDEIIKTGGVLSSPFIRNISKEHKVVCAELFFACRAGVFIKTGRSKYKCVFGKIEPIHARKTILAAKEYNKLHPEKLSKKKQNEDMNQGIEKPKEEIKAPLQWKEQKPKTTTIVKRYFWGLFKITKTITSK